MITSELIKQSIDYIMRVKSTMKRLENHFDKSVVHEIRRKTAKIQELISRNNYVVIDSDAKSEYGKVKDISKFKDAKHYIRNKKMEKISQADQSNSLIPQIGLCYKEGNVDIPTIESYLDDDSAKINSATKSYEH